jgi:hypothetical protein
MKNLVILCVLAACGSSTSNQIDAPHGGGDGPKTDAPVDVGEFDFGCGGNTACSLDKVCCTNPGPPVSFSCVDPASCPAADKITCDGPDECGGAAPVCCGVDVPDGTGSFPQCNPMSVGTSCTSAAACQTNLPQSCNETATVVICHVKADCAGDPVNNKCCTFNSNGAELTFCIDGTTAALGGATCHN